MITLKNKKNTIIGVILITIILAISFFSFLCLKRNSFEKEVDLFLDAIYEKQYDMAYDYLDVPKKILKSEIALIDYLKELGVNIDDIKSYNAKSIKNKDKDNSKVMVTITNNDNSKTKIEFKVSDNGIEVPYISNYKITVPSGTVVKLNEYQIDNAMAIQLKNMKKLSYKKEVNSKEETQEVEIPILLDSYEIPALIKVPHTLILEHPQGLNVNEKIDLSKDYSINELIGDENLTKVFGESSKVFIGTVIDSVINQKDFTEVNKLISPNSQNKEIIETAYNQLKDVFKGIEKDGVKITYNNYKLVDIFMNDICIVDKNKISTLIQYNLAYTEVKTLGSATITNDKTSQKVGILTFEISEDGTLLLDNSQGIFTLHQ